mmetsp:Transcript_22108/g.54395  ORF Transcript_22108/g.54395 Transcript_22108/m.54395 type:complete len:108 (-) Transcript_22108:475-798(-)
MLGEDYVTTFANDAVTYETTPKVTYEWEALISWLSSALGCLDAGSNDKDGRPMLTTDCIDYPVHPHTKPVVATKGLWRWDMVEERSPTSVVAINDYDIWGGAALNPL